MCVCVCLRQSTIENDKPHNYVFALNFVVSTSLIALAITLLPLLSIAYFSLRFVVEKKSLRRHFWYAHDIPSHQNGIVTVGAAAAVAAEILSMEPATKTINRSECVSFARQNSILAWKSRRWISCMELLNNDCNHWLFKWKSNRMCVCSNAATTLIIC